ncbi:MAG: GIY-YIG nuclease family protein [bacterium]|nr:GIY-YIG nuclease family protein [bacterium]
MYYVYILQSQNDKSFYTGVTEDLKRRISEHNSGSNKYSNSKRPFKLVWYSAFLEKKKAYDFEKYLKSGSGFAFARKRLV